MNTKRTRICNPFSHNGCFTCKARRIKCDETKPLCIRCTRSGLVCEGYREREQRSATISNFKSLFLPDPTFALTTGCSGNEQQHRFAQLGIELLSFESFRVFGASGDIFGNLLPQLSHSIPSVKAAATALGAAFEMLASYDSGRPIDEAYVASRYRVALRATHLDLSWQTDGTIPIILVCFILGVTELFLQQESNALFHLRAAFKLLDDRRTAVDSSSTARYHTLTTELLSTKSHLETILRTVDFHISSYALSKSPELPTVSVPLVLPPFADLSSAHVILIQLIHVCYDFAIANYKFKYSPEFASPSVYLQQGRYIAHLSTWLKHLHLEVISRLRQDSTYPSDGPRFAHALTLRITALSILVHLSCVLCPHERAYDAHSLHFQQISADSEAILSARHKGTDHASQRNYRQCYTTGPGIIQPLFLTACKYRDPVNRRHAIRLLSVAGGEGPWSGAREACISTKITDLEENWREDPSLVPIPIQPNFEANLSGRDNYSGEGLSIPTRTRIALAGQPSFTSPAVTTDVLTTAWMSQTAPSLLQTSSGIRSREKPTDMAEIAEEARIHSMGMGPVVITGRALKAVNVRFTRCRDIEAMLSKSCSHEAGQKGSLDAHLSGPCMEKAQWEVLEETLEY